MDNAYARARRLLTIVAMLSLAFPTLARPLLVAPKQRLSVPPPEQYPGQWVTTYGPLAIDGDSLLVSASHIGETASDRVAGAYLFQRAAGGTWSYVKPLFEAEGTSLPIPLLSGNLAIVQNYTQLLVFERGAQGWTKTGTIAVSTNSRLAVRVEDGSIYMAPRPQPGPPGCIGPYEQWRKVGGTWQVVATIGPQRCQGNEYLADINDGRALITQQSLDEGPPPPPGIYAPNGTATWARVAGLVPASIPGQPGYTYYGPGGSIGGNTAFIWSRWLYRNSGGNNWVGPDTLVEPEYELPIYSGGARLRGSSLVLNGQEEDYELPPQSEDIVNGWKTLRVYRPRADGYFEYFARLNVDFLVWDWSVSEDGSRVAAVSSDYNYDDRPSTRLYVFEIPATATFPGTQQDTFESGNFSRWTTTVGQFSIASTSNSNVLRQQDITGDAKAFLTGIDWTDQAIEADIRPTEFAGTDRWFGLATRQTDDRNYYYVTYRNPNRISLRRNQDGVITELAHATNHDAFAPGKSYRVRLESVGDQHAVFLDGFPVIHAKDSAFTHGHPGVLSYRTRFDADNVVVSGGTRLLLRFDTYKRAWSNGWINLSPGQWSRVAVPSDDYRSYALRQSDTSGDAKWFSKIATGNQVISARVRPMAYGTTTGTNSPWVGIAAHVIDDKNYYYVTLRGSSEFSLRRVVNGQVQILGTVPQPVALDTWYDLRLEIIGVNIRAYVNGDLKISATDSTMTGGGRNAILMYKAAADWYHYIAYQP